MLEWHQIYPQRIGRPENGGKIIFRVLNEKKMQPRILYPAKLSFRMDGDIKSFQDR